MIWYGTPHSPWITSAEDKGPFAQLTPKAQDHYGELVAMDRSIGALRKGLRKLGVADDTLVWFTSDNGGLPGFEPDTTGGLRGYKSSMYEGGLRVPCVIEWPAGIAKARITKHPAGAVDIFPTIAEICDLPKSAMLQPQDGLSLKPLFAKETGPRTKPLPFQSRERVVVIDNDYKLLSLPGKRGRATRLTISPRITRRRRIWSTLNRKSPRACAGNWRPRALPSPAVWRARIIPKAKSARNRRAFSGIPSKLTNRTSPNGSSGRVLQLAPKTIEIK